MIDRVGPGRRNRDLAWLSLDKLAMTVMAGVTSRFRIESDKREPTD